MPPAVAPAFTPDDHQDDSSDMVLDPVLQSVIRNPAFQRICPMEPNLYTFGSDSEMDEFLFSDYSVQLTPIDYKYNTTYIAQLISDIGLPISAATHLVAKLPALHAATKAMYASPF
ncbi:unnamed protein product [Rhizophagus irregularis]|nr:unnamed protein product [Rhizophagus irregularis]